MGDLAIKNFDEQVRNSGMEFGKSEVQMAKDLRVSTIVSGLGEV